MTDSQLELGRRAYRGNSFSDAFRYFSEANEEEPLGPQDLEMLSTSALLSNHQEDGIIFRERAHQAHLEAGNIERAARIAIWTGMNLMQEGEFARGGGWLAKGHRLITEPHRDCVEQGYLLVPQGIQGMMSGDFNGAYEAFTAAEAIGERFGDRDLVVLARHGRGRSLIAMDQIDEGTALLDEAMVEVTSQGIFPMVIGIVYCSVIDACHEIFDIRRAQEWTAALDRWSASQPDTSQFRGQCLVFRAELKVLHGEWTQALEEAVLAAARLSEPPPHQAAGAANYQRGELHRLRGEFDEAENAYVRAAELGHPTHPGMALLRLAQDRVDKAAAAMHRESEELSDPPQRCRMLPAYVEVMVASGESEQARQGADELEDLAARFDKPYLQALASYAMGLVVLEEGDARAALAHLRKAQSAWREIGVPYENARTSVLIGLACRAVGDDDTFRLEVNAARTMFEQLGAKPALAALDRLTGRSQPAAGLTGREVEVLRLLATGRTNREIAGELVISEKTVARHVANIFLKLGLSSRAAATAYAVKSGLA